MTVSKSVREVMLARWDEVDPIFTEALTLPGDERPAYVVKECAGDRELLDTVSALLASSESDAGEVSGPGPSALRAVFGADDDEAAGEGGTDGRIGGTIGPYRIVGRLGRGGMSEVYEGERADGAFDKRVAIKVLRGVDAGEMGRRFRAERRILSSLEHPNIAPLLDGGSTEDGLPYLIMELVRGESITASADRRRLTVEDRLALFEQVAGAVLYAHTRLVVHRDIKPSNVLVGEDGTVKLVDFGIAKLLEEDATDAPTRAETRWMTLEYASPEQVLGRPVTTATDVHALGALLFELLAGRRPFAADGSSRFALEEAICNQGAPSLPSVVTEAAASVRGSSRTRLRGQLAGDLDAIVARALRKEPAERYQSVQELLDDLERYRTGFPVRAREGLWGYRLRKTVARHAAPFAAAAVVALVLSGALLATLRQQAATERERDRANEAAALAALEAENAQLVIDFLSDVFRGDDPTQAPSDTVTARELLAWGTRRVDEEFGHRPEVQAELHAVMGGAHYNLGLLDEGAEQFERAVELMKSLYGEQSPEAAAMLLRLAGIHGVNESPSHAVPLYEEALAIQEELYGSRDPRVADTYRVVAVTLRDVGRAEEAEGYARHALTVGRELGPESPLAVRAELSLAYVLRDLGRLDEARVLYEHAIDLATEERGVEADTRAIHLNNYAYLLRASEEYTAARPLYEEALQIHVDRLGRGHPRSLLIAQNLAGTLSFLGLSDDVIRVLGESAEAAEAQWPAGHWRVGSQHMAHGRALLRAGRTEESAGPLRAGVASYREQLGEEHDWTRFAEATLAVVRIIRDGDTAARAEVDELYTTLRDARDGADGMLPGAVRGHTQTFTYVLRDVGLEEDAERFTALLE